MKLRELLKDIEVIEIRGDENIETGRIHFDSRKVKNGDVFVAVKGTQTDGHMFIDKAVELGAKVIVAEEIPQITGSGLTFVKVKDSARALGWMAANYFGRPSGKLELVGVTGTNGKTTTTTLLHALFTRMGFKTGLISTIENKINEEILPSTHTTPDPVSLNDLLAKMVEAGCSYAFMEVSSHSVDQQRIAGLKFKGGIFSNITHDHLDYHGTFQEYIVAKKKFFDNLGKDAFALANVDDKRGTVMLQNTAAARHTYSLKRPADFKAKIIENTLHGLHLELDGYEFYARLIGEFNAYNLLAAYAAARLLGQAPVQVLTELSKVKPVEGRFDHVASKESRITGIVDYAHTPDALEKVLTTIKKFKNPESRIITIVGCGGNRDRTKRPKMAAIACELSDLVVLTSDNPRFEKPETIITEMETGIPESLKANVLSITDRKQAIKTAVKLAKAGDVILLAGKGHEKYQEIKGEKHPFDDKRLLEEAMNFAK